jgi:membrane-associated phospholipid phosphatase
MANIQAPPQPGSPRQAHHLLPLGAFGSYLLFGALFCMLATAGFGWLARGIFADRFVRIDDGLIIWLHGYWSPLANQVMLLLTMLGDTAVLALLVALVAGTLLYLGRWIDAVGLVLAAGGAGIVDLVLKATFQRVRPDLFSGPLHLTSYSFPSGHSMGSTACYGMLAVLAIRLVQGRLAKIAIGLAAALLILGIGLSRIYFGVHYPTDVLGGFLAGAIWLVISTAIMQVAEWHARRRART